ncbi:hypothetical protein CEXT_195911 [Caerostris extrusa]|uniref:Uncharacterized protein n=1 Tax=Caerostris extrusa TaxID=172846 RepID=A0AAV4NXC3_CAEEX|nr:hypothetical protein CEXT_195911 [Caerostris extrusa]
MANVVLIRSSNILVVVDFDTKTLEPDFHCMLKVQCVRGDSFKLLESTIGLPEGVCNGFPSSTDTIVIVQETALQIIFPEKFYTWLFLTGFESCQNSLKSANIRLQFEIFSSASQFSASFIHNKMTCVQYRGNLFVILKGSTVPQLVAIVTT